MLISGDPGNLLSGSAGLTAVCLTLLDITCQKAKSNLMSPKWFEYQLCRTTVNYFCASKAVLHVLQARNMESQAVLGSLHEANDIYAMLLVYPAAETV